MVKVKAEARVLVLMRGLPGSGKSTVARAISSARNGAPVRSTDDFFELKTGSYVFEPKEIGPAHAWNQARVKADLAAGHAWVIVDNTNTQAWEMQPYRDMAKAYGYAVEVVSLFDGGCTDAELAARNAHGVPEATIARMRARWEAAS